MPCSSSVVLFFSDSLTTVFFTLSLHDALPISSMRFLTTGAVWILLSSTIAILRPTLLPVKSPNLRRSEEHTSELQSRFDLVCRLLLEKKKTTRGTFVTVGRVHCRSPVEARSPP